MPSVLDHPTTRPLVRAMWATIRLVVVLPLVPVTATTGIVGVIVVGRLARLGGRDLLGGGADRGLDVGGGQGVERVRDGLTQRRARPRWRHGKATTRTSGSEVGRTRTARRRVPASLAMARTRRSTARRAKRCRKPDPGAPGRVVRSPMRRAKRSTASSLASLIERHVERELHRGPREVEVGAFEDAQLDE